MTSMTFAKYQAARRSRRIITLDMDGTFYDPWACCGINGNYGSSQTCTHLRHDTVERLRALQAETGAKLVVLSYRSGMHAKTMAWCAEVGLDAEFFFIPGAPDDVSAKYGTVCREHYRAYHGQVAFKAATVMALQDKGYEIVGAFEDSQDTLDAYAGLGVRNLNKVDHLVKVQKWERSAGRLGAPKPVERAPGASRVHQMALADFREATRKPKNDDAYYQNLFGDTYTPERTGSLHSLTEAEWAELEGAVS